MAEIGQTLLQASQVIVGNFQRQQQFQLQQMAFEQQLRAAEESMKMKERELASRERMARIQAQEAQLRIQSAERDQKLFSARGGAEGIAAAEERTRDVELALKEAQTKSLLLKTATGGTGDQAKLRENVMNVSRDAQERLAARSLAKQDPQFKPFQNASLDEIRSIRSELDKAAANPDLLQQIVQQQIEGRFNVKTAQEFRAISDEFESRLFDLTRGAPLEEVQRAAYTKVTGSVEGFDQIMLGGNAVTVQDRISTALGGSFDFDTIATAHGHIVGRRPSAFVAQFGTQLFTDGGQLDPARRDSFIHAVFAVHGQSPEALNFITEVTKQLSNIQR